MPRELQVVTEQQSIQFDRLRNETLNAIFKAERLRETNAEQALSLIDEAINKVQTSGLGEQAQGPLMGSLKRSRSSLESYVSQREPLIELQKSNNETLHRIKQEAKHRDRIEQELATISDQFNRLMEERRFSEAEVLAKQAKEMAPENPVSIVMFEKSRLAKQIDFNEKLVENKNQNFLDTLNAVEEGVLNPVTKEPIAYRDAKSWKDLTNRRAKYGSADNRKRSPEEIRIEKSLSQPISLNFDQKPFREVVEYIHNTADINIVVDQFGLEDRGFTIETPISINLNGIELRKALNLILQDYDLAYLIDNDVLKITSNLRQQGKLEVRTYPVADLVISMETSSPKSSQSMVGNSGNGFSGNAQVPNGVPGFADPTLAGLDGPISGSNLKDRQQTDERKRADFNALVNLLTDTIHPESWDSESGLGSVRSHDNTLSLVIRQTQRVHDEIAALLAQLRRLQDLQVTIEVRFITVTDRFFEQIGVDFDFNLQDTLGSPQVSANGGGTGGGGAGGGGGVPLSRFGKEDGGAGQGGTQQTGSPFDTAPTRNLVNRDVYQKGGSVLGLTGSGSQFSPDLDIPFRQGSFAVGAPDFGGFNPDVGLQVGFAILSDIEAFFFIQAAQQDERSNLMSAPKITVFNGQPGTLFDVVARPFVVSLTPSVGLFAVGFTPQIEIINEGVSMTVTAVISADRRYVRLAVVPTFTAITDVFTFSFQSGGGGAAGAGGGGAGGGGGGGAIGVGGVGGAGGQNGNVQQVATLTIQQPVQEIVTVLSQVSVPDGGTVLLGGVKRLREGRNMAGVPILNKLPYISRLFKNSGVGRETESLMLMVTPRIIIQEEEEELLDQDLLPTS